MPNSHANRSLLIAATILFMAVSPRIADATIVEFETVLGNFQVNLYDNATPQTVANFLNYVNSGAYTDSIFHRSVAGFVVQGGGFITDTNAMLSGIQTNAPVTNEPVYSNVRGTIAMAKVGGDPNSATSQWFFNLANNAADLDGQNGGFTVFGEVTGNGMTIIDALAALSTYNLGGAFAELPLQDYTATDFANMVVPDNTNFVIVTGITVTDTTVDTAAGLNPTPNTSNSGGGNNGGGNGGGGGFGLLALIALFSVRFARHA